MRRHYAGVEMMIAAACICMTLPEKLPNINLAVSLNLITLFGMPKVTYGFKMCKKFYAIKVIVTSQKMKKVKFQKRKLNSIISTLI